MVIQQPTVQPQPVEEPTKFVPDVSLSRPPVQAVSPGAPDDPFAGMRRETQTSLDDLNKRFQTAAAGPTSKVPVSRVSPLNRNESPSWRVWLAQVGLMLSQPDPGSDFMQALGGRDIQEIRSERVEFEKGTLEELVGKEGVSRSTALEARRIFQENQQIRQSLAVFTEEADILNWRMRVLQSTAAGVQSGRIVDVDDILEKTIAPAGLTDSDVVFAANVLRLAQATAPPITVSDQTPDQRLAVIESVNRDRGISTYGLFRANASNITKVLAELRTPQLPVGMTTPEFNALLAEASFSVDDIARFEDQGAQIDELYAEYEENRGRRAVITSQFAEIEISEIERLISTEKLGVLLSEPGLALFLPVEEWRRYAIKPLGAIAVGGIALAGVQTLGRIPVVGRHLTHQDKATWEEFELNFQVAKRGGFNTWMALGQSFDRWDTNGFNKFIVEIAVDPTTYFGFGMYAKVLKGIPVLKRIAGAELAYMRGTDAAFLALQNKITKISGQTLDTVIGLGVRDSTRTYMAAVEGLREGAKIPFKRLASSEVATRTRMLVAHALNNPLDTGLAANAGRLFIARKPLGVEDLRVFYRAIGKTPDEVLLTSDSLLSRFDTLMSSYITGLGGRALTKLEAATVMIRWMGEAVTEETVGQLVRSGRRLAGGVDELIPSGGAVQFLDDSRKALDNQINSLINDASSKATLSNVTNHTKELIRLARTDEVFGARARWLSQTAFYTKAGAVANFLLAEKLNAISRGFARAYLMFSFYAPLNVMENALKTAFRGMNPIPGFGRGFSRLVPLQGRSGAAASLARRLDFGDPVSLLADRTAGLVMQTDIFRQAEGIVLDLGPIGSTARPFIERTAGMSENTFRRLSRRTRRDWVKYVLSIPDDIFIKSGGRIGLKQQANHLLQGYERALIEQNPAAVLRARSVADAHAPILLAGGFSREQLGWVTAEATRRMYTDPQSVVAIARDFTPIVIDVQEIGKIITKANVLTPTVREFLSAQVEAGTMVPNLRAVMANAVEAIYDEVLASPALIRQQLSTFISESINKPINTTDDMLEMARVLQEMDEIFGSSIDSTLEVARAQYQRYTNAAFKGEAYDDLWKSVLTPYMEDTERDLGRLVTHLRGQMDTRATQLGLSDDQVRRLTEIFDGSVEHISLLRQSRLQQHAVEERLLASKPSGTGQESQDWWKIFYEERDQVWRDARGSLLDAKNRVATAQMAVEVDAPVLPNMSRQRFLTTSDIGNLYGVIPHQISETMFRPEFALLRSKDDWSSMVMQRVNSLAAAQGTTADAMGYSLSRVGHVYDTLASELKGRTPVRNLAKPQLDQLQNVESEIRAYAQRQKSLFPEEGSTVLDDYTKSVMDDLAQRESGDVTGIKLTSPDELNPARQQAIDAAWNDFRLDFPVYDVQTAFNETAKTIFPFWSYEAHRPFWLARTFLEKPGVYAGVDKYKDYSDDGYVNIPGIGDVQVNFLRGSIFMGGFRRLTQRDFPDYYDQFPGFSGVVDQASRYGFYPNIAIAAFQVARGAAAGTKPQTGELLPPLPGTLLEAAILLEDAIPGSAAAGTLRFLKELLLPNRFRDYLIMQQVGKIGGPGKLILDKINSNTPLTDEEISWWSQGDIATSRFNLASIHTGLIRMRPQERVAYQQAVKELYRDKFGVPIELQDEAFKFGVKVSDWLPLGPEDRALFREIEGDDQWRGLSTTLRESEFGQVFAHTASFHAEVRKFKDDTVLEKESLEAGLHIPEGQEGHITIDDWLNGLREQNVRAFTFRQNLSESNKYGEALTDFDQIINFALDNGEAPLIQHPVDTLASMYFDIQPEVGINPDTNNRETLWEQFFTERRIFRETVPERMRSEVFAIVNKWDTELEAQREADFRVMRPYFDARDFVLGTLTAEDQVIVAQFNATDDPDKRVEFRERLDEQGNAVVSNYQGLLSAFRQNLRELQPEVDARLVLWNGLAPRTEAALEITRQLRQQYGLR